MVFWRRTTGRPREHGHVSHAAQGSSLVTLFSPHHQHHQPERRTRAALVFAAALVALVAARPLAAQPPDAAAAAAPGNANGNHGPAHGAGAPPATGADRSAAARAAANQLRGIGNEEALMGGPSAYRDPYRSAADADETRQTELMKAERVPTGGGDGFGYDPLPPGGRRKPLPAAGADADAAPAENGPARTPQAAAQAAYKDAFKGPAKANANGQAVYRMPW